MDTKPPVPTQPASKPTPQPTPQPAPKVAKPSPQPPDLPLPIKLGNPKDPVHPVVKTTLQSIERLSAVYKSLWLSVSPHHVSPALDLVLDLLAEQGYGAMYGFIIPDGSVLNEVTGLIDGPTNTGDRLWRRDKGWYLAQ